MSEKEHDPDPGAPPEPPASTDQPKTDTSTDWDEWMEKHRGRPRPSPDVADAEGKFTQAWVPRAIGAVALLLCASQNAAAQAVIKVSDTVNIKFGMLVQAQADWTQDAATRGYQQNPSSGGCASSSEGRSRPRSRSSSRPTTRTWGRA